MKLSELLARLDNVTARAGGWSASCPAHADNLPSFSIRKKPGGGVYLHCFAGCTYDAILDALHVTRADMAALVDDEPTVMATAATTADLGPAQIAALQTMADVATPALLANDDAMEYIARRWGATAEDVQRLELGFSTQDGGRILAFIRNGQGQAVGVQGRAMLDGVAPKWDTPPGAEYWRAGFLGVPTGKGPVLVTEGPGDAISVAVAGYDALPVFGATSGAQVAKLADALKDREVIVIGDNDDAGRKFAAKVAEVIPGAHVATVPAEHNDLSDWRTADPDKFRDELAKVIAEALKAANKPAAEAKAPSNSMAPETIVRFIEKRYTLLRSEDGIAYAVPKAENAPRIAREVAGLKSEVSAAIWRERGRVPGTSAIPAALSTVDGIASQLPITPLSLRSAVLRNGGDVVIQVDLGDETGQFVEVTAHGWQVLPTNHPGPRATFRRTSATHALPVPVPGGNRDQLRELLGLDADDPAWLLVWGWLVSVWFADTPRPIMWTTGPQGSGKSTRSEMVLNLVDPATALSSEPGKNQRDDTVAALGRYVPSWDNVATISPATSDWYCRLVTGANNDGRELYTNDGLRVRSLMRTGIATSITMPMGLKPDALERAMHVELERMPDAERRTEAAISADFTKHRAEILGAVFTDLAGVLANLPEVIADMDRPADARQYRIGRMADYTQFLHALDRHVGPATGYAEAYLESVHASLEDVAEDDAVLATVRDIVRDAGGVWRGTAEGLLVIVKQRLIRASQDTVPTPKTGKGMGDILRIKSEALRAIGVVRLHTPKKRLELQWTPPADYVPGPPAPASELEGPLRLPKPSGKMPVPSPLTDVLP